MNVTRGQTPPPPGAPGTYGWDEAHAWQEGWRAGWEAANAARVMDAPGKVGRDHPHTSREAALIGPPTFGSDRWRILELLFRSDAGMTAAEVAAELMSSRNQTATRLGELREAGLARIAADPETGNPITRETSSNGARGRVHVITTAGVKLLSMRSDGRPSEGDR